MVGDWLSLPSLSSCFASCAPHFERAQLVVIGCTHMLGCILVHCTAQPTSLNIEHYGVFFLLKPKVNRHIMLSLQPSFAALRTRILTILEFKEGIYPITTN
jgi:hypothetical protein